jgi:prepilin-type N-terminal cleavage/methylation domain-containing protein
MSHRRGRGQGRRGFTLLELVVVMLLMGVIASMAIPHLDISRYRIDAAAQQVKSVFQTAQRTSLTRQYDVIVSVDTVKGGLRIAEDVNNNGAIEVSEWKFWRPPGEGNRFTTPPKGLNAPTVTTAVVGANLKTVDGLPSVIFHRDGSTSSDMEIYIASIYKRRTDYCVIALTRSTGRSELYRLSGSGSAAKWQLGQ